MYRKNQFMCLNWLDLVRHISPFRWTGEKLKSRWWSVCGIFGPRRLRVLQTLSSLKTSPGLCCEASPVALPVCQRCIPSWSAGVVATTSGWWKRLTLHRDLCKMFSFWNEKQYKGFEVSMADLALQNNCLGKVSHRQWNRGKHFPWRRTLVCIVPGWGLCSAEAFIGENGHDVWPKADHQVGREESRQLQRAGAEGISFRNGSDQVEKFEPSPE